MYGLSAQQNSGLQSKFEHFKQEIELTQTQKDKIIGSHTHLRQNQFNRLDYINESFLTGSYKKKTMIRPPYDVDMFVVMDEDERYITPNSLLNRLKKDLKAVYPNTMVRQDKPCLVLDFTHCKFELTPAIKSRNSWYDEFYIPNTGGNNSWQSVENPRVFEAKLSDANRRLDGKLTPLIKMMKQCRENNNIDMKSYDMELKAVDHLYRVDSYRDGVQKLLRAYNWTDQDNSFYQIEAMSDYEFARYCRTSLFGNKFPA